jgi:hypothetical protein
MTGPARRAPSDPREFTGHLAAILTDMNAVRRILARYCNDGDPPHGGAANGD